MRVQNVCLVFDGESPDIPKLCLGTEEMICLMAQISGHYGVLARGIKTDHGKWFVWIPRVIGEQKTLDDVLEVAYAPDDREDLIWISGIPHVVREGLVGVRIYPNMVYEGARR